MAISVALRTVGADSITFVSIGVVSDIPVSGKDKCYLLYIQNITLVEIHWKQIWPAFVSNSKVALESLPFYQPFTIPVLRSYYPSTTFYYPSTTFLLSQYTTFYYPSTTYYYPSTTFLLYQYHFYTIPTKQIWPAFVSNSIVGLESLPFYQPFTIPVPIQIDNTQRLSFPRPDSLLHWEQTCQLFKMFIYDMQEHSHEHFRTCANFNSTGLMNTVH